MLRIRSRRRMSEVSSSNPATDVSVWRAAANVKPRLSFTIWVNSFADIVRRIITSYNESAKNLCGLGLKIVLSVKFWRSPNVLAQGAVTWTFGPFVINNCERRKVHAKETLQLHSRGEG